MMKSIQVAGTGAVSPAGWGVQPMCGAVAKESSLPLSELARPGWDRPLAVRKVPPPENRPAFLGHARLRRASPISRFAAAAALEAIGEDTRRSTGPDFQLGIILCVMSGCVNYSRRFYDETLRDPATASPLVFPETVFNAPASHIAALLGTTSINYTLVGDPGTYLQGLALAADWLLDARVDGCLVIGAEENDWLTSDAFHLFFRDMLLGDGAGALYLKIREAEDETVLLGGITDSHLFTERDSRTDAAARMRQELDTCSRAGLLCDGLQGIPRADAPEQEAWKDWSSARISPKRVLGEGLAAASAWQCVLAVEAIKAGQASTANVSVVGCNQQAIGAQFTSSSTQT